MGKKSRFCANCGKETNKLVYNLCPACYSELKEIKVPKKIVQKICPKCNAVLIQGFWIKTTKSLEKKLSDKLKKKLRLPEEEKLENVDLDLEQSKAHITTSVLNQNFKQDERVKVELVKKICKECRDFVNQKPKINIQLRFKSFSKKLKERAVSMVKEQRKAVQKLREYRNGFDIHLNNKGIANTLARKLAKEFHCKTSRTVEQYSWNKQKNRPLHRHTILLRQI